MPEVNLGDMMSESLNARGAKNLFLISIDSGSNPAVSIICLQIISESEIIQSGCCPDSSWRYNLAGLVGKSLDFYR